MADILANEMIRFRQDSRSLGTELTALQRVYTEIAQELKIIDVQWEGTAKQIFSAGLADELTEMQGLVESIRGIQKGFEEAEKRYRICETEVSDLIDSLG